MRSTEVQTHVGPYAYTVFYDLGNAEMLAQMKRNYIELFTTTGISLIAGGCLFLFDWNGNEKVLLSCLYGIVGLFYILRALSIPRIFKKGRGLQLNADIESNRRLKAGYTLSYTFHDEDFEVRSEQGWESINYEDCYGYLENEEYLFILPNRYMGYALEKKNCDEETLAFLKNKLKPVPTKKKTKSSWLKKPQN
ncbi:hypothetical protein [Holdemania massiliensis]|uniref:hypothetical protein n=1 Tax=Holdemania massiliensis TaxID=1468449 RepID=UPI001F06EC74|nr:hypothetical protein [Holdemania massiliensis]MCH1940136.1 hypothetical protein [Holdemania massiliensis]